MRHLLLYLSLTALISPAVGQEVLPLYEAKLPCVADQPAAEYQDTIIGLVKTYVDTPYVEYYAPVPRSARPTAVIVVPGGGYWISAWDYEGTDFARRLVTEGYHVFVLAYRLPGRLDDEVCRNKVALADGQRAVQLVRSLATERGFAPERVAVMGFSAGGHLAGSVAVHPVAPIEQANDPVLRYGSRPDRSILVYPVTLMNAAGTGHAGSQRALLGDRPTTEQLTYYDLPGRVDSLTPPTLLVHASDDRAVPVANALRYYEALVHHGVPADLRVYATGEHGFALARGLTNEPVREWFAEVLRWLEDWR